MYDRPFKLVIVVVGSDLIYVYDAGKPDNYTNLEITPQEFYKLEPL